MVACFSDIHQQQGTKQSPSITMWYARLKLQKKRIYLNPANCENLLLPEKIGSMPVATVETASVTLEYKRSPCAPFDIIFGVCRAKEYR